MTDSRFIPNSFQTPNIYVDDLFKLLDNEEKVMVIYACRLIFGWQKRTDRIAASRWQEDCDLHAETVASRLKSLVQFGILVKVAENDPRTNKGPEWALQLDEGLVDWEGLKARKAEKQAKNKARIETARSKIAPHPVGQTLPCGTEPGLSDRPAGTLSDSPTPYPVPQGTQNTENQIKTSASSETSSPAKEMQQVVDEANRKVDAILGLQLSPKAKAQSDMRARFETALRISPSWDGRTWQRFDDWLIAKDKAGESIETFASWWKSDAWRRNNAHTLTPEKIKTAWPSAFELVPAGAAPEREYVNERGFKSYQ